MNRLAAFLVVATVAIFGGLSLATTSGADSEARKKIPKVGKNEARYYMQIALKRRLGYSAGYNRKVRCNKRLTRVRVHCPRISWIAGDVSYKGRGTIWFTRLSKVVWWNYSYKIVMTNHYCLSTGKSKCYKKFVVK